jgi:hypothetical protein
VNEVLVGRCFVLSYQLSTRTPRPADGDVTRDKDGIFYCSRRIKVFTDRGSSDISVIGSINRRGIIYLHDGGRGQGASGGASGGGNFSRNIFKGGAGGGAGSDRSRGRTIIKQLFVVSNNSTANRNPKLDRQLHIVVPFFHCQHGGDEFGSTSFFVVKLGDRGESSPF